MCTYACYVRTFIFISLPSDRIQSFFQIEMITIKNKIFTAPPGQYFSGQVVVLSTSSEGLTRVIGSRLFNAALSGFATRVCAISVWVYLHKPYTTVVAYRFRLQCFGRVLAKSLLLNEPCFNDRRLYKNTWDVTLYFRHVDNDQWRINESLSLQFDEHGRINCRILYLRIEFSFRLCVENIDSIPYVSTSKIKTT